MKPHTLGCSLAPQDITEVYAAAARCSRNVSSAASMLAGSDSGGEGNKAACCAQSDTFPPATWVGRRQGRRGRRGQAGCARYSNHSDILRGDSHQIKNAAILESSLHHTTSKSSSWFLFGSEMSRLSLVPYCRAGNLIFGHKNEGFAVAKRLF